MPLSPLIPAPVPAAFAAMEILPLCRTYSCLFNKLPTEICLVVDANQDSNLFHRGFREFQQKLPGIVNSHFLSPRYELELDITQEESS